MKIRAAIAAIALILLAIDVPHVQAATNSLTLALRQTPSATDSVVTFYGTIKPARSGLSVKIQGNTSGVWKTTRFATIFHVPALVVLVANRVVFHTPEVLP